MSLLSSLTPLALGAFDLYRRRREAQALQSSERDEHDLAKMGESLQKRMQELEASDLEQARITSELTQTFEAFTKSLEASLAESRAHERQAQRLVWSALGVATAALVLAVWALAR